MFLFFCVLLIIMFVRVCHSTTSKTRQANFTARPDSLMNIGRVCMQSLYVHSSCSAPLFKEWLEVCRFTLVQHNEAAGMSSEESCTGAVYKTVCEKRTLNAPFTQNDTSRFTLSLTGKWATLWQLDSRTADKRPTRRAPTFYWICVACSGWRRVHSRQPVPLSRLCGSLPDDSVVHFN